jgi:hypothetical protein
MVIPSALSSVLAPNWKHMRVHFVFLSSDVFKCCFRMSDMTLNEYEYYVDRRLQGQDMTGTRYFQAKKDPARISVRK